MLLCAVASWIIIDVEENILLHSADRWIYLAGFLSVEFDIFF